MIGNPHSSFFARMKRKFFNWRLQREIFGGVFPHAGGESDEGYPFTDYPDMERQTEALNTEELFEEVERQVAQLPKAYGKCFRYVMHRDIHERLALYAEVAKRRKHPKVQQKIPALVTS